MPSGSASQSLVDPATSVKKNEEVPVGGATVTGETLPDGVLVSSSVAREVVGCAPVSWVSCPADRFGGESA